MFEIAATHNGQRDADNGRRQRKRQTDERINEFLPGNS
jgi:hypothetical protein